MYSSYLHFKRKSGLVSLAVLASCLCVHPLVAMDKEENPYPCSTPIKSSLPASYGEKTEEIDSRDLIRFSYDGKPYEINLKTFLKNRLPSETRKEMDGVFEYYESGRGQYTDMNFRYIINKTLFCAPSKEFREKIITFFKEISQLIVKVKSTQKQENNKKVKVKRTEKQEKNQVVQKKLRNKKATFLQQYGSQMPFWERKPEKNSYMLEALYSNEAREVTPSKQEALSQNYSDLEPSSLAKRQQTMKRKEDKIARSKFKESENGVITELKVSGGGKTYDCNLKIIAQEVTEDTQLIEKILFIFNHSAKAKGPYVSSCKEFQISFIEILIYSPENYQSDIENFINKQVNIINIINDEKNTQEKRATATIALKGSKSDFCKKIQLDEWIQHPPQDSRFWKYEKVMNNATASSGVSSVQIGVKSVAVSSEEYNSHRFEEDASPYMPKAKKRKINHEPPNETNCSASSTENPFSPAPSVNAFDFDNWLNEDIQMGVVQSEGNPINLPIVVGDSCRDIQMEEDNSPFATQIVVGDSCSEVPMGEEAQSAYTSLTPSDIQIDDFGSLLLSAETKFNHERLELVHAIEQYTSTSQTPSILLNTSDLKNVADAPWLTGSGSRDIYSLDNDDLTSSFNRDLMPIASDSIRGRYW